MNTRYQYWLFIAALLLPSGANAVNPNHPGLIGLLELPYQWQEPGQQNQLTEPISLLAAPSAESARIGVVEKLATVETH